MLHSSAMIFNNTRGPPRPRLLRYLLLVLFASITIFLWLRPTLKRNFMVGFTFSRSTNLYAASNQNYFAKETINGTTCSIPKLDPFHASIKHLIKIPKRPRCYRLPLLFNSTLDSRIVPVDPSKFQKLKIKKCFYRVIKRKSAKYKRESLFAFSEKSFPVSLVNSTKVLERHEFIAISCKQHPNGGSKIFDVQAFAPLKSNVEEMLSKNLFQYRSQFPEKEMGVRPNVLVFGLDAVSHMNFRRTFPQSYKFIKNNMSYSLEMEGYNKVGENTFPNVVAMLTALTEKTVEEGCGRSMKKYDDCPFIWKEYAKRGYRTGFAEDSPGIAIFNHQRKGFNNPPTHYYLRPYSLVSEFYTGSTPRKFVTLCQGPRLGFETMLDYLKKFVYTMEKNKDRPYFYFSWSTSLTHDDINDGLLGDSQFLETLQWFQSSGHLNNTFLMILSDHGSRIGDFRKFPQGQFEDRLPVLFIVPPKWFPERFATAYENLQRNQERLLTAFDIHQTFKDILDLGEISEFNELPERQTETSPGISLFHEIPPDRTCADASIDNFFCVCNLVDRVDVGKDEVLEGAAVAVKFINDLVKGEHSCAPLKLAGVTQAQLVKGQELNLLVDVESYIINFITNPGRGEFEGYVKKVTHRKTFRNKVEWTCGTVVRTNSYGNQSHCVQDNMQLKSFCFCK